MWVRLFLALWGVTAAVLAAVLWGRGGEEVWRTWLLAGGGSCLGSAAGAWWIARGVTAPVRDLTRGAQFVLEGRYTHRLPVRRRDEVGWLVEAFNRMLQGLQERERVRSAMDKVVSKEIAEELLKGEVKLGGEVRFSTVLFADIRGFTGLSEAMEPPTLVSFLNEYLSMMSRVAERNHGVIDKYIGDCVMALFGAPVSRENDVDSALKTALEMVWCLEEFNYRRAWEGLRPISIGVGVNTGPVIAGNMGSEDRLNYTVVGDAVNLAYRLEALTRTYNVNCIVSEYTQRESRAKFIFRELDTVRVKGRLSALRIFELWDQETPSDKLADIMSKFQNARQFYLMRDWERAQTLFRQVLEMKPQDGPSRLYLARLEQLRANPPGTTWDGVFSPGLLGPIL